ncbi:hypothetical protein BGI03_09340 [Snodgrassella alvi]|uniref:hypothetical protein n=3 Tax=Snodgrassella alvi TaxID=1196083 RepID=UPI0009FF6B7E|nr:hypothetical protein [Snodgrassella alvi]ORF05829.1 hypothetical protein BGH98_07945 [Snodgrassella alvi]ORF12150.1 hypothetical protein BGI01_07045 [Snodgrassella alvi]ORF17003.1 hypothetical protein BGI03_09340 [Snodgrassella alvi]
MDTELEYICLRSSYPVGQAYYRLDLTNKLGYDEIIWLNSPENLRDASLNVVFSEIREVKQTQMLIINSLYSNKEKFNFITEEPQDGEYVWVSDLFYEGFASFFEYDSSWDTTKQAFKNHILFTTADGAAKATKSIIQILSREAARKRFKPLTKAPQNGTKVYVADVTAKEGYKEIIYNSEFEYLLNNGLLFSTVEGAIQASTAMRKLINPPIPDTTKKPEPDKQ